MRYVALLQGVNLGPNRKVGMADLKTALVDSGLHRVATYLRSGNAVFDSPDPDAGALTEHVQAVLSERFGIDIPVVVVSERQLAAVVAANPYSEEAAADPTKVHATFVSGPAAGWDDIDSSSFAPEEFSVGKGVVYLHLPNGMGRSKLAAVLAKKSADVVATTRNWRTVEALRGMLEAD